MSSSINDVTMKAEITDHLNLTMNILEDYVVGVEDISRLMYKVEDNLCSIFGTNSADDKFLLYRCDVSDLTADTDLFTSISASISDQNRVNARKTSAVAQKLFRNFQEGLSASSRTLTPSYSLEYGANAEGVAFCHSAKLIGKLTTKGTEYKITFGQLIDFEHTKDGASQMTRAIGIAKNWSKGLTTESFNERLKVTAEGVTITRTDGQPIIQPQIDDDSASEALARKLQAEDDLKRLSAFDVFQQRKPLFSSASSSSSSLQSKSLFGKPKVEEIKVNIGDVKVLAEANLEEAMAILQGIVMSTNPYKDRTAEQIFTGLKPSTVSETLGKINAFETNARKWSHKISFGKCYWMIPVVDEKGVPLSVEMILDQLRAIAYFGPEINDLLVHWVKREVYLSTEFAMDTVTDNDGNESKKRVCTIGMFKVHQIHCVELSELTQQDKGDFKSRIDIPDDIYSLKPDELIAGIQQNISLFVEHMLKTTGFCQVEEVKGSDVQTMVQALHNKHFHKKLNELGAQLYWKFLTPGGKPNSLKLYIDLTDEKNRVEVYALFRVFLEEFDPTNNWSFTIYSEAINAVREWGKGQAAVKDPVPPLCIQMTWNGQTEEIITPIVQFIDQYEPSHLREFGIVSREVVRDGSSNSVIVELNAHGVEKLPEGKEKLEKLLAAACRKFTPEQAKGAWINQELDSSVKTTHGYKILRPNTLKYAMRRITGPEGEMIRFIQEYAHIDGLKISMINTIGGSDIIVLQVNALNEEASATLVEKLNFLLGKATEVLTDKVWLYESKKTPSNEVRFTVEQFKQPGFGGLSSGFGGFSSQIGAFSATPSFGRSQLQPKATQYDPGADIRDIFDVTDDEL
jgi:hypothetical protein